MVTSPFTGNRRGTAAIAAVARYGWIVLLSTVLVVATAAGPAAAFSSPAESDRAAQIQGQPLESDRYAVVQGDRCVQIDSLGDGTTTIEEFYDYRTPETTPSSYTYSSYGTTGLQADDTSRLFLYEGADDLALVMIHDRLDGETDGGSATMQFDGLPADGDWAVEDDDYDGRDDEFTHEGTSSRISWVWSEGRTDGAAFSGLGADFAVTVTPAFNEAADIRYTDSGYDGRVTDWQVLSGDDVAPERTSLDMHEPIEVRSGGCTAVTDLAVDKSAAVGDEVAVDATVTNEGERSETVTVPFAVDGEVVDERTVTLEPGQTATVSTTVSVDEAGTRTVSVGERTSSVAVSEGGLGDGLPGFGTVVALVALVSVAVLVGRRE